MNIISLLSQVRRVSCRDSGSLALKPKAEVLLGKTHERSW
jgi:hypothetical protein